MGREGGGGGREDRAAYLLPGCQEEDRAGGGGAGVGEGSSTSNWMRPSLLRSSQIVAAGPRLLPLLSGAGAGGAGISGYLVALEEVALIPGLHF